MIIVTHYQLEATADKISRRELDDIFHYSYDVIFLDYYFLSACDLAIELIGNKQWLGGQLEWRNGKECDSPLIRIGRYTSGFV